MSFLAQLERERRTERLRLVTGKAEGQEAWWFILVRPDALAAYEAAMQTDRLDLADYGTIIKSGWGPPPDMDAREAMVTAAMARLDAES